MLINATQWSDLLTSPATVCALFLLALFFVGELVTFFCTTVPKRASAWLETNHLVILGRLGNGWANHQVIALETADHSVALDESSSWVTVARAPRIEREAPSVDPGPSPEHLRAFARWLAERGRLDEWSASDQDHANRATS
jgi:hypothetical protein